MKPLVVLAAGTLALAAATADAAAKAPAWTWDQAAAIAYQRWAPLSVRPPLCPKGVRRVWGGLPDEWGGLAQINGGSCVIRLNLALRKATWRYACAMLAHEYGHLWGHGHEPSGIMTPAITVIPRVCIRLGPRGQVDSGLPIERAHHGCTKTQSLRSVNVVEPLGPTTYCSLIV